MKMKLALAAILIATAPSIAFADGDATKGKKVFKKCKACHTVKKKKNKVGPHLIGIVGRAAGTVEKFKYSKAMKAKAGEIGNWDEAKMNEYITDPKKFIGGRSKMTFKLKKADQRADVIAYLKTITE